MATVKFSDEMPKPTSIKGTDRFLISDGVTGEAKAPDFNQAKEYLNITGIELEPLVGGTTSGTALVVPNGPAGEQRTAEVSSGKWYDFGSGPVEASADRRWKSYWSGTSWVLKDMGELPQTSTEGIVEEGDVRAISGDTTYKSFSPAIRFGRNLIDTSLIESGYIATNGNLTASVNWIRLPYLPIPEELKGEEVTISGIGSPGAGGNIVSFRTSSNIYISGVAGSGLTTPDSITVTIPLNAANWGFSIENDPSDGGIGSRPNDNPFVNSFMVNKGNSPLPYETNGVSLKHEAIDLPDEIIFKNEITENGNGAVPAKEVFKVKSKIDGITVESPNLINYPIDVEYGYYNVNGNPTASVNWIRTKPIYFQQDILSRLSNSEEVHLSLSGGGLVSSSAAIVSFFDENGAVISSILGSGASSFPVSPTIPLNAVGFKGTIVNQPGIDINANDFILSYQAEIGDTPTGFQPYGQISINPDSIPSIGGFDTREIILKKVDDNNLQIFYHIGGDNDVWFRVNLIHQVIAGKFTDVWRLDSGFIVKRVSKESFTTLLQVINTGVYENAIYTSGYGYTDALGSAHGCEMLDEFGIFMDGIKLDVSTMANNVFGTYLTFTTRTFFKAPNGIDNVGKSFKKWEIKDGLLRISNNIAWSPATPINTDSSGKVYLGMLSIFRKVGATQVTHTAFSNEDGKYYDVTNSGFTTSIFTDANNPRRNQIVIWGSQFKAEVSVVKRQITLANGTLITRLPNAGMFVQNTGPTTENPSSPDYNKVYPLWGSTTINNGDFWESIAEYKFSNI